ncbi:ankyrin repeat domain-containing protein [Planctomycetota bacterium]
MDAYVNSVARYLFAQGWQIALLAVIVGLTSFALRNRSAHIRYLLWLIVLAKCLFPPVYSVPVAVLPERSRPIHMTYPILPETRPDYAVTTETGESVKMKDVFKTGKSIPTVPNTRKTVVLLWSIGAFLFLLWVGNRAMRYTLWLRRRRMPLPPALHQALQELFTSLKLKKSPRIWLTRDIGQPFVWGLLRGGVYLPVDFADLDGPQHCRTILAHELSHVARFDAGVNVLQVVAQAIYWFHPLVWWANRKIRMEREKCCDEMAVVHLSAPPEQYTGAIVEALATEHRSARPIPTLAIAGSVKDIEERIKTMLRPGKRFYKRPSLIAAVVALLIAFLTVPGALVLTTRAETRTEAERSEKPSKLLAQAAFDGDIHQVKLRLSAGAAVDAKYKKGKTALHNAAGEGHTEIVRLLIAKGADINAKAANGQTPLHDAALNDRKETANLLIRNGADVNAKAKYGFTAVQRALLSEGGGRQMVELLVRRGAQVSVLHLAAHRGDIDKVKKSLEEGTNIDMRNEAGHTPLFYAASAGQMHVVEFLISRGAEVDAKDNRGETPLFYAGDAGWRNVAELLIAKGADVNARGHERSGALESAAWLGRGDVAKLLIAKGADIKAKDQWGYIPLHAAASSGLVEVSELLISKGSDVNAKDKWAGTTLTNCVENAPGESGYAVVKLLIDKGAEVNAACTFGCTVLHHAVGRNQPQADVVRLLIASGANVNAKDNSGRTPLRWSVLSGRKDIVELLLVNGADINTKDNGGSTPLDIAVEQNHTEIADLIRKYGEKE